MIDETHLIKEAVGDGAVMAVLKVNRTTSVDCPVTA
jgi:hypothetical protein